jgi:hypothetical protein
MAVAALHVLTPPASEARALDHSPATIGEILKARTEVDGLKNQLDLYGPLNGPAADELVRFGQLQIFEVAAYASGRYTGGGVSYFRPFNVPGISPGSLSQDAEELLSALDAV